MEIYINERITTKIRLLGFILGFLLFIGSILTSSYVPQSPYWIPVNRILNTKLVMSIFLMIKFSNDLGELQTVI